MPDYAVEDMEEFHVDNAAEAMFGMQVGPAILKVHPASLCADDETCVIHKPSDHHMRDWPLNWRADRGLMERTCPHGVGHPDPDDLSYQVSQGRSYQASHGCDGCCAEYQGRHRAEE